jgi:hypothetical protein
MEVVTVVKSGSQTREAGKKAKLRKPASEIRVAKVVGKDVPPVERCSELNIIETTVETGLAPLVPNHGE